MAFVLYEMHVVLGTILASVNLVRPSGSRATGSARNCPRSTGWSRGHRRRAVLDTRVHAGWCTARVHPGNIPGMNRTIRISISLIAFVPALPVALADEVDDYLKTQMQQH